MFWWQRRRITMARRNDNNSNNNNNSRRIVFPATFLSVALLGIYFLISVYLQLRHDKFISDVSNIDSIHRLASTIDRPVTISTTSIIDRVKTNQNSATSIDSLAKRNNLTNIHQRQQQQKLKSKPTILPETADHLIQLSLQYDVKNLTDQLMNNTLIYFPGPWDGAPIVLEEYKLVFFTQGKVACTVFKQLFRRMMNIENWNVDNTKLPHNPRENGLTYLYHYNVADALTILSHPDWTRAIFVRDPKERLLSAYLDKAARKKGSYIQRHCCNQKESTCGEEANASFMGFLQVIEKRCCCDPHWRPQTKRIDSAFRPFVNFVGNFDRIHQDTKRLLNRLNTAKHNKIYNSDTDNEKSDLWTKYGASGWGSYRNESIFAQDTKARHQTSAITKLKQYYNTSVEAFVEDLFAGDYDDPLLNFTSFSLF